jgi:endonuclease YncB( thermonuclease family)
MGSGPTFFDNSKAGKFTPTTRTRLRSPRGLMVWITYKFCSSMLSSAVDYKASSVKHLRICGVDSPEPSNRTTEKWSCKKQGERARESRSLATPVSFEARKRFKAP